jgi:hypothetical protein
MREWLKDVSSNLVGGVLSVAALAFIAMAWGPTRSWLIQPAWMHRWGFIVLLVCVGAAAYLAGRRAWRRRTGDLPGGITADMVAELDQAVAATTEYSPFEPTPLQREVIRVLRMADDESLKAREIAALLQTREAISDVDECAQGLVREGWAQDLLSAGGREYRLTGPGLAYARDHGYPADKSKLPKRGPQW